MFKTIKMKTTAILICFLSVFSSLSSQELIIRKDWWKTFSGEINGKQMAISVNRTQDGLIVGSSCDILENQKVQLTGRDEENFLSLKAKIKDSIIGSFEGKVRRLEDDFYEGNYTITATQEVFPYKLKYTSGSWGTPDKRYMDFPGTDQQLEDFAQQLLDAFAENNTTWLSQHMGYPLPVYLEDKKQLTITSPSQFIEKYEQIATKTLLDKMTSWKTCNLSSNHSGVMLGRGEIWIWRDDTATDQDPKYRIKNIVTYNW